MLVLLTRVTSLRYIVYLGSAVQECSVDKTSTEGAPCIQTNGIFHRSTSITKHKVSSIKFRIPLSAYHLVKPVYGIPASFFVFSVDRCTGRIAVLFYNLIYICIVIFIYSCKLWKYNCFIISKWPLFSIKS